ncbi:MAG TPA: hypothetical protein VLH86_06370 [Patescibacteria group bacterium]|nr:hypothetical protein [Patescibacteria group bacterium]
MSNVLAPFEGHPLNDIEGFVVVTNSMSSHGADGMALAEAIQANEPHREVTVVDIDKDPTVSRDRLIEGMQRGGVLQKLIVIGGGDGSLHYHTKAMFHPDMPADLQDWPFTATPLGSAFDGYMATHDGSMIGYTPGILEHPDAHIIDVHPLELTDEDETILEHALLYLTAGPTAAAAKIYASPEHRAKKAAHAERLGMLIDLAGGLPAMWRPEQFLVEVDGQVAKMTEMQFINGDRMAIEARYDTRLSRREMHFGYTRHNNPAAIGATALRMKLGVAPGRRQVEPVQFTIRSGKPVPAQVNGEYFELPGGSTYIVRPSERRVRMWATRPDA